MTNIFRIFAFGLLSLPAACGDPMEQTDGIMPVAGLAQINNSRLHIIYPNGMPGRANPGGAGPRAEVIIRDYYAGTTSTEAE